MFDFDGSKENDPERALFVSLANPLVVMALGDKTQKAASQTISLSTHSDMLPKGRYSFACCEWEQKGYRNTTDIEAVILESASENPIEMSLVEFETLLLQCESAAPGEDANAIALDELLYRRQTAAKNRLLEVNNDIVDGKIAILDRSFSSKIRKARDAASSSSSAKIKMMRERQAQNLQAVWDDKRSELLARKAADVLVRRFATGTIEVI